MTKHTSNWSGTNFDDSRREQLRQAQTMSVRQRLEALDHLAQLSERMQAMPKRYPAGVEAGAAATANHEPEGKYGATSICNEVALGGCTPTPLASYLKALGVLRLISKQHRDVQGFWRGEQFILRTSMTRKEIEDFFLNEYEPTPIISPWNGRAGFLEGEAGEDSNRAGAATLRTLSTSKGKRFGNYRMLVEAVKDSPIIAALNLVRDEIKKLDTQNKARLLDHAGRELLTQKKKEQKWLKDSLLISLRSELADEFLPWIDACYAIASENLIPAPLLGSGGNEGSMDFSINHAGYLLDLIDRDSDEPTPLAKRLITNALYGDTQYFDSTSNIGFLDTRNSGGVNMTAGFIGKSSGNVWESILTIEGTLLFAPAVTKKLESTVSSRMSFPFSVSTTYAGNGGIATNESSRQELWMPIWHAPASISELETLLAEGRSIVGKRPTESGLDMLRALATLGVSRGIAAFERYGFYERRGKGYFVTSHLGHHKVPAIRSHNWIMDDLDRNGWLQKFEKFAQGNNSANRFRLLNKRLEDMLFALSGHEPHRAGILALLVLLGEIQSALTASKKAREALPPVPRLSERWAQAADDGTPAFRIARALAGLKGMNDIPLPLRAQLFPLHPRSHTWIEVARSAKGAGDDMALRLRLCTGLHGSLPDALANLLTRRLWLAEQFDMPDKPLRSPAGARLDDVLAFLRDDAMDRRITALLPGLSLCDIPRDSERETGGGALPAAFALLKLNLTPDATLHALNHLQESERLPVAGGMLAQLAAGNVDNRAVEAAWRRLHASGLSPVFDFRALPRLEGQNPRRVAAALLIPLRFGATATLARTALSVAESSSEAA